MWEWDHRKREKQWERKKKRDEKKDEKKVPGIINLRICSFIFKVVHTFLVFTFFFPSIGPQKDPGQILIDFLHIFAFFWFAIVFNISTYKPQVSVNWVLPKTLTTLIVKVSIFEKAKSKSQHNRLNRFQVISQFLACMYA
jgi:hypothetical protein